MCHVYAQLWSWIALQFIAFFLGCWDSPLSQFNGRRVISTLSAIMGGVTVTAVCSSSSSSSAASAAPSRTHVTLV